MFSLFKKKKIEEFEHEEKSIVKGNFLKKHTPRNCLLGFTIPLTKNDFYNDLARTMDKDFAKSLIRSNLNYKGLNNFGASEIWEKHCEFIIGKQLHDIEKTGVHIIRNFTLADLSKIVNYDIFILVGHHDNNQKIEFFDGLYNPEQIVNNIPNNFNGIIELSICNSASILLDEIKKSRNCTVIGNVLVTKLEYRLAKIKLIMQKLSAEANNYITILTKYSTN